jgi:hypothetical protein
MWLSAKNPVERRLLLWTQRSVSALGQFPELKRADSNADQPKHFNAERVQHAANVPVLAFLEDDF